MYIPKWYIFRNVRCLFMKRKITRLLSIILVLATMVSILCIPAFAESYSGHEESSAYFYVSTYGGSPKLTLRQSQISATFAGSWNSKKKAFNTKTKTGYGKYTITYREVYSDGTPAYGSSWKSTTMTGSSKTISLKANSCYKVIVKFSGINISAPSGYPNLYYRDTCYWTIWTTTNCGVY